MNGEWGLLTVVGESSGADLADNKILFFGLGFTLYWCTGEGDLSRVGVVGALEELVGSMDAGGGVSLSINLDTWRLLFPGVREYSGGAVSVSTDCRGDLTM